MDQDRDASSDLFTSAWHKFLRGFQHAQHFQSYILAPGDEVDANSLFTYAYDFDPDRQAVIISVGSVKRLPPYWSTTLGDALFNYRCALDHVAWALVTRGSSPPSKLSDWQQRKINFPVVSDGTAFTAKAIEALPGITVSDLAIVRARQPYKKNRIIKGHWLLTLRALNDQDKHREVRALYLRPTGGTVEFLSPPRDCVVTGDKWVTDPMLIQGGAKLGEIPLRITGPNPHVAVTTHLTGELAIDKDTAIARVLDITARQIKNLLEEFGPMPPTDGALAPLSRDDLPT